jgi:hypothetical protein
MSGYKSIFDRKPDLSSIVSFTDRVDILIKNIKGFNIYRDIEEVFVTTFEKGYANIHDYLKSHYNLNTLNVFYSHERVYESIPIDLVFANIEIYANCLYVLSETSNYYHLKNEIALVLRAFSNFVTFRGFELKFTDGKFLILNADLPVKMNHITDEEVKTDFLTFYNYTTIGNLHEKHKLLFALAHKLESRKAEIENLFGNNISKAVGYFANQFHIRHSNLENIEDLSDLEIEEWYNYIYSFFVNCYVNLDKLKKATIK